MTSFALKFRSFPARKEGGKERKGKERKGKERNLDYFEMGD